MTDSRVTNARAKESWPSTTWLFWITTLVVFAAWSVGTLETQGNLPLDHIDLLAWGPSWQLCYWKHPPLPAWIAEAVSVATDRAIWPQFLLGPAMTAIATIIVWRAALDVTGPWRALIAALAVQGCIFYNQGCDVFNHNSVQLPFLAAAAWAGWRAINGSTLGWIAFGFFSAVAVYGKYSAAIPAAAVMLFTLTSQQRRATWKTAGPWLAIFIGLITIAPHIYGMSLLDFSPLRTPFGRQHEPEPWWGRAAWPAEFFIATVAALGGVWIFLFALFSAATNKRGDATIEVAPSTMASESATAYYTWIVLAPVVIAMIVSAVLNLHLLGLWALPWFPFVGLACVLWIKRPILAGGFRAFWVAWLLFAGGMLIFAVARNVVRPYISGYIANVKHPGDALALKAEEFWIANAPVRADGTPAPLTIVIGDMFSAGNIAVYGKFHPDVLLDGIPVRAPWIDLARIKNEGALLVWRGQGSVPAALSQFGEVTATTRIALQPRTDARVEPMDYGLAVISSKNR